MSKYQEQTVSGEQYQRCKRIVILNPYKQSPEVLFEEESVFKKSDGAVIFDTKIFDGFNFGGSIKKTINEINESFEIYDPVTQTKTGETAQLSTVYNLIWSVYMNEAIKRDANAAKQQILFDLTQWFESARQIAMDEANRIKIAADLQEPSFLEQAIILAATKVTEEEKKVVMDAYEIDKIDRRNVASAESEAVMAAFLQESITRRTQAEAAAEAAYNAVING